MLHNWFNNRSQAKKKAAKGMGGAGSASESTVKDILTNLIGKKTGGRKLQRAEIWQKRNKNAMHVALDAAGFNPLAPGPKDDQTGEERTLELKVWRAVNMQTMRQMREKLYQEASEDERAAVERDYNAQESKGKKKGDAQTKTPEEYQQ